MNPTRVLTLKTSSQPGGAAVQDIQTLAPGCAQSLRSNAPMALRVMQGRAWVTLDDGPDAAHTEAAGDVFLHAGQTLWVVKGQHVVIEPLGRDAVQFCWRAASAVHAGSAADAAGAAITTTGWTGGQAGSACGA